MYTGSGSCNRYVQTPFTTCLIERTEAIQKSSIGVFVVPDSKDYYITFIALYTLDVLHEEPLCGGISKELI